LATLGYILYQLSQLYPSFTTLIPSSIFFGFCLAPIWTAHSVYLTVVCTHFRLIEYLLKIPMNLTVFWQISGEYAQLKQEIPEVVHQRFFGIFFCFYQSSQIWGNLMSSFLLHGSLKASKSDSTNTSVAVDLELCGYNFCDEEVSSHKTPPSNQTLGGSHHPHPDVRMLVWIFVGCSVLATMLMFLFVDPLSR